METNITNKYKSFTSLEQSEKLTSMLPLESADMTWEKIVTNEALDFYWIPTIGFNRTIKDNLFSYRFSYVMPCWTLGAILDFIPQVKLDTAKNYDKKYWRCCAYYASDWHTSDWYDNPIDACYEMIVKLNELKIL